MQDEQTFQRLRPPCLMQLLMKMWRILGSGSHDIGTVEGKIPNDSD